MFYVNIRYYHMIQCKFVAIVALWMTLWDKCSCSEYSIAISLLTPDRLLDALNALMLAVFMNRSLLMGSSSLSHMWFVSLWLWAPNANDLQVIGIDAYVIDL